MLSKSPNEALLVGKAAVAGDLFNGPVVGQQGQACQRHSMLGFELLPASAFYLQLSVKAARGHGQLVG